MPVASLLLLTLLSQGERPNAYVEKASDTPHLYQLDPAGGYSNGGKNFCAPTAAANAIIYLSRHGYQNLFRGSTMDDAYALVRELASKEFIGTADRDGTTDTTFILGLTNFVQKGGIHSPTFKYEGYRPLRGTLSGRETAMQVDLDWIKAEVAKPNTVVWMHLGYYKLVSPSTYERFNGHFVNVVGYGTDGAVTDPNMFIIRNPVFKHDAAAGAANLRATLPGEKVMASRDVSGTLTGNYKGLPRDASDMYSISGPAIRTPKGAAFVLLDGAIALELPPPSH